MLDRLKDANKSNRSLAPPLVKHKRSVSSSESLPEPQPRGDQPHSCSPASAEASEPPLSPELPEEEKSPLTLSCGPAERSHKLLGGSPLIVVTQCQAPADQVEDVAQEVAQEVEKSPVPSLRPKPKLLFEDFNEKHAERKKEIQLRLERAKLREEITLETYPALIASLRKQHKPSTFQPQVLSPVSAFEPAAETQVICGDLSSDTPPQYPVMQLLVKPPEPPDPPNEHRSLESRPPLELGVAMLLNVPNSPDHGADSSSIGRTLETGS